MKFVDTYKHLGILSESAAFENLIVTLKDTIRTHSFFVAWEKVLGNVAKVEISLNILNSLLGKDSLPKRLAEMIRSYPEVVPVLPLLIAVRDTSIRIATVGGDIEYLFFKRNCYSEDEIAKIVEFTEKCGLLKIFSDKAVKNLVDYCIGVEVGLDTNARKNRSGDAMETLSEVYIKAICQRHGYRYLRQATVAKIKAVFGRDVPTDKANRYFDFAVDTGNKIYLLEVNYYGGGGSKLKSVAGEFKSLFELVTQSPGVGFIWITDGQGWHTAKRPLLETFIATDFVMNINMLSHGFLEEILIKGL
ncbi:type II restriction endonuclease [Desulfovibrio cuneatus]|uniref:type II restriction endonuclease n=1 Tax=Desulfovibrio cuneatus TaxID=159728 RepID=UPI000427DC0F|nr:type II restriction endonuclease [Desulfovibrio cuneatus]